MRFPGMGSGHVGLGAFLSDWPFQVGPEIAVFWPFPFSGPYSLAKSS